MDFRRIWLAAIAALICLPIGNSAFAQLKVGYTDAQLIVAQMDDYRSILQQLQSLTESGQMEYQGLITTYQEKLADYQKKQALLSESARASREQELTTMQGEIQQFLTNKEQELQQREAELMNPLLEKVQNAINGVAAEQSLDLVLNAQAAGSPVLLYADESMDITETVMTRLGIQVPDSLSTSTSISQ
jgi:outer membrane protein